jgi:hypothetical protein
LIEAIDPLSQGPIGDQQCVANKPSVSTGQDK